MFVFLCRRVAGIIFAVIAAVTMTVVAAGAGSAATLNTGRPVQHQQRASGNSVTAATAPLTAQPEPVGPISNEWNGECLDGRLGHGNVTMQPCGNDGTHENWVVPLYAGRGVLQNVFNHECLDGRLGSGNVTLSPCGADGTHEEWILNADNGYFSLQNVFNHECLDGRLGNVTLQPCGADGLIQMWLLPGSF